MPLSIPILALLFLAATATSTIAGIVGMAGGILLLAILLIFMPHAVVIPIHGMIQLVSNLSRCLFLWKHIRWKFVSYFFFGLPLGVLASTYALASLANSNIPKFLIIGIIFYVVFKPKRLPHLVIPAWGFFFLGLFSGFLSLIIGAVGPFIAPFFLRDDFRKEEIVATKAAVQSLTHTFKIPAFLYLGFEYQDYHWFIGLLMLGTIIGSKLGTSLLGKIDENIFQKLFKTALFLAAIHMLCKMFFV